MKVKAKFVFLIQGSLEPPAPWFNHLACSRFYSLKAALIMLGTREGYLLPAQRSCLREQDIARDITLILHLFAQ